MEKFTFWVYMLICAVLAFGNMYFGLLEIIDGQYITGFIFIIMSIFLDYIMGDSLANYIHDWFDERERRIKDEKDMEQVDGN